LPAGTKRNRHPVIQKQEIVLYSSYKIKMSGSKLEIKSKP